MKLLFERVVAALTVVVAIALSPAPPVDAAPRPFTWPLDPRPRVVTAFAPPEHDWLPGHRGVDLGGTQGQTVSAAGSGTVVFAGTVAGKPVVSIDHPSGVRTTYEPVVAVVRPGQIVVRGDAIGTLTPGHEGCEAACLHWGVRRGREYLDPLALVRTTPVRLKSVVTPTR